MNEVGPNPIASTKQLHVITEKISQNNLDQYINYEVVIDASKKFARSFISKAM